MAWTSLSDTSSNSRFDNLPTILCGPIVRKVTKNVFSVFIVTKSSIQNGSVKLYTTDNATGTLKGSGQFNTIQFGANLHIAMGLIENLALDANKTYYYNIIDSGTNDLLNGNLIKTSTYDCSLSYGDTVSSNGTVTTRKLPSFKVPPDDIKDVRLFHGSCRKFGGEGDDAFEAVDINIEDNYGIVNGDLYEPSRPQFLILTGDQIYGDDVPDYILAMLMDAENRLIGPYTSSTMKQPSFHSNIGNNKLIPGQRRKLITDPSGVPFALIDRWIFKSHFSHLVSLGEYYMAYLFAWSDVLWPIVSDFPQTNDVTNIVKNCISNTAEYVERKKREEKKVKEIELYLKSLKKVRRLLANVSTYMIFDDHEITDDWNLSKSWFDSLNNFQLGKDLICNGMSAYTIFQDWGNKPEDYKDINNIRYRLLYNIANQYAIPSGLSAPPALSPPEPTIKWDKVARIVYPKYTTKTASETYLEDGYISNLIHWHFNLPFSASSTPDPNKDYEIRFLDTRTKRGFEGRFNTALISERFFDDQLGPATDKTIILISPTPVFGPYTAKKRMGLIIQQAMKVAIDYEVWGNHPFHYFRFVDTLGLKFKKLLILAGDVHYSNTYKINLWRTPRTYVNGSYSQVQAYGDTSTTCIVQSTSSSMKNKFNAVPLMLKHHELNETALKRYYIWKEKDYEGVIEIFKGASLVKTIPDLNFFDLSRIKLDENRNGQHETAKILSNSILPDVEIEMLHICDTRLTLDRGITPYKNPKIQSGNIFKRIFSIFDNQHRERTLSYDYRRLCQINNIKKITFGESTLGVGGSSSVIGINDSTFFHAYDSNDDYELDRFLSFAVNRFEPTDKLKMSARYDSNGTPISYHTHPANTKVDDGQRIDLIDDKMTPTAFIPAYKEVDI